MKIRSILAAFLVVVTPTSVLAQDMGGAFINAGIGNSGIEAVNQSIEDEGDDESSHGHDEQYRQNSHLLEYVVSRERRQANMDNFLASMTKSDPASAANLKPLFDDGKFLERVEQSIRPIGLRSNNLADAYTIWWVSSWEAVSGREAVKNPAMYSAVKKQASAALLSVPALANLTDSDKQEMAEMLMMQGLVIAARSKAAKGDSAKTSMLAGAVQQSAKVMGVDLAKMELTVNGFVAR